MLCCSFFLLLSFLGHDQTKRGQERGRQPPPWRLQRRNNKRRTAIQRPRRRPPPTCTPWGCGNGTTRQRQIIMPEQQQTIVTLLPLLWTVVLCGFDPLFHCPDIPQQQRRRRRRVGLRRDDPRSSNTKRRCVCRASMVGFLSLVPCWPLLPPQRPNNNKELSAATFPRHRCPRLPPVTTTITITTATVRAAVATTTSIQPCFRRRG